MAKIFVIRDILSYHVLVLFICRNLEKFMKIEKFYTPTCTPCARFTPIVDRIAKEVGVEVVPVNVAETPVEGINSVPTLRLLSDEGEFLREHSGVMSGAALRKWIQGVN